MDLHPSDTDEAVRAASEDFLRDRVPLGEARARPTALWRAMAEIGWFGMSLPEADGGVGIGLAGEALVFAELGRHLAPVGAVAAAVAARVALDAGDPVSAAAIIAGDERVALAIPDEGGRLRALDAGDATLFIIVTPAGAAIHAVPPSWTPVPCLDPSALQSSILAPTTPARAEINGPAPALHQMLAASAFALGAAEAARDMAAAYANTREQFGRPIGAFQGVKHPCADMAVRCSAARAQLLYAALALEDGASDAAFHVAAAKRLADLAAVGNGRANVQVHGGFGMTDEADVHLILKRAHLLSFISPPATDTLLS